MIAIYADPEIISNIVDVATVRDISVGGIMLIFISLLVYQLRSQQKRYEEREVLYIKSLEKKDKEYQDAKNLHMEDLRKQTTDWMLIQKQTDQLREDLKMYHNKNN